MENESVYAVGVSLLGDGSRVRPRQHRRSRRRGSADHALPHPGRADDRELSRPCGKLFVATHDIRQRHRGLVGLDQPQRSEVAHQAAGTVDDGGHRGISIEVRAEVVRQLRQDRFLVLAPPLALLLLEAGP